MHASWSSDRCLRRVSLGIPPNPCLGHGPLEDHPALEKGRCPAAFFFLQTAETRCPDSEVRIIVRHPRLRTSESVGFVAAHGDAFELHEFAEEVFDQVTPLVDFRVDDEWLCAPGMLGDYDLGSPLVQFGDNCVRIKGLVSQQTGRAGVTGYSPMRTPNGASAFSTAEMIAPVAELDTFDKWHDPYPRIRTRAIFFM